MRWCDTQAERNSDSAAGQAGSAGEWARTKQGCSGALLRGAGAPYTSSRPRNSERNSAILSAAGEWLFTLPSGGPMFPSDDSSVWNSASRVWSVCRSTVRRARRSRMRTASSLSRVWGANRVYPGIRRVGARMPQSAAQYQESERASLFSQADILSYLSPLSGI